MAGRSVIIRPAIESPTMLGVCVSLLLTGLQGSPSPTIEIDSVPAYGVAGHLTGSVTGATSATHEVAVYIGIEGAGWLTKPYYSSPTVGIQPDGSFSANVTTGGGLGLRATMYCAALVVKGYSPPPATSAGSVPRSLQYDAIAWHERYGPTLQFAGRTWEVKEFPSPVGPGPNRFSSDPSDIWVDALGRLHLTVSFHDGQWWSTEVLLTEQLGFGTYHFVTESEVEDLDPNLTFGAFTYDSYGDDWSVPNYPFREIDFEDSRWGNPADPTTSQVVVQPSWVAGTRERFTVPDLSSDPRLSRWFDWGPARVDFTTALGDVTPCNPAPSSVIHEFSYSHNPASSHYVPSEGRERFRFNLWLNRPAPLGTGLTKVIISDFRFTPARGAFAYGCHINPVDSLVVLKGSPAVGASFALGVDNPSGTQATGSTPVLSISGQPSSAFPCGVALPGFGMVGGQGELLVGVTPPPIMLTGSPWPGAGSPAPFALAVPPTPALVGVALYAQGIMVDWAPNARVPIGLTEALQLCIQP